jgi:photosystem II stability/assembly factor-like uncharacterized protein
MRLKSNMNKWVFFSLLLSTAIIQCRPARHIYTDDTLKPVIFLQIEETGIWKPIGPFGAPEPLAKVGESSSHGSGKFLCVNIHPQHPGEILAGHAASGLFKTVDNGRTWTQQLKFPFTTGISRIVRFRNDPKHLLATSSIEDMHACQYGYGLLESFDNGENWQRNSLQFEPQTSHLAPFKDIAILDKKKGKRLIAIDQRHIYVSIDGAKTWKASPAQAFNLQSLVVNPHDENSVFICGNGVLYSRDGGMQWKDITLDICTYSQQEYDAFRHFSICFSREHKNQFYLSALGANTSVMSSSTDNLSTGKMLNQNMGGPGISIPILTTCKDRSGIENLYVGLVALFRSKDGGASFEQLTSSIYALPNHVHDHINNIEFSEGNIYIATDGGIELSKDEGKTWTSLTDGSSSLSAAMIYGFDQSAKGIMMCGTAGNGILALKNGLWYCSALPGDGGRVVAINDSTGFAVGYKQANYMTADAGLSFTYKHAGDETSGNDFRMSFHQRSGKFYLANKHLYKKKEGKYFEILSSKLEADKKINAFWVNPANENEILLCKDGPTNNNELTGRFFYTNDGGQNWLDRTYRLPILQQHSISGIAKGPGNQVMVSLNAFDTMGKEMHKVYVSDRNGLEFVNISKGLPNVPVNTVVYIKDHWICGNHTGVYVFREGKWESLGSGFPAAIVTEIRYNEEQGVLLASTFGRGLWTMKW